MYGLVLKFYSKTDLARTNHPLLGWQYAERKRPTELSVQNTTDPLYR